MFEPIGLESRLATLASLAGSGFISVPSELGSALWSALESVTRLDWREPLSFGTEGPASDLTVEIGSGSARFLAVAPGRSPVIASVPELGTWQEACEEAAAPWGAPIAFALTPDGAAVTVRDRRGAVTVVDVVELAA